MLDLKKSCAILMVLLAGIASATFAQEINQDSLHTDHRERIVLGLKAGINYSNAVDRKGDSFVAIPKYGLAGGLFLSMPLGKNLGFQPEALFSQKGFKGTGQLLGSEYDLTRTANFLDIPLYIAFKPIRYFILLFGPQYSYLIHQKNTFANSTTTIAQEQVFGVEKIRNSTFAFSGGADIVLSHVVLSGRAGIDFLNNNGDGTAATPRYKNGWFQLTVGYIL